MNYNQISSKVTPTRTEGPVNRQDNADEETHSGSGSWRRKLILVATAIGIAMYLRRNRSRDTDSSESESSADGANGGGVGRRLTMIVLSNLAFALFRRVLRRFGPG